jgi:hypothetical protein
VIVDAKLHARLPGEHHEPGAPGAAAVSARPKTGFESQKEPLGQRISATPLERQRHRPDGVGRIQGLAAGHVVRSSCVAEYWLAGSAGEGYGSASHVYRQELTTSPRGIAEQRILDRLVRGGADAYLVQHRGGEIRVGHSLADGDAQSGFRGYCAGHIDGGRARDCHTQR